MKKLLLLVVLGCLVAVLGATAGVVSVPAPSKTLPKAAALTVAEGFITSGKTALAAQNIKGARDYFKQAVAADPNNQEANFFYGVTRVFAVFEESYGTTAGLDSVREIFERSGFTFQTFGLYNIEGTEPLEGPPSTMPRTGEAIDFVKLRLLPELDNALVNLGKVNSSFTPTSITPAALGTYGDNLEADYADALAIKALVNLLKCNLNLLVVYGPDVHIPDVARAPEQMMTYKELFMADANFLTPREASRLGTAKSALIGFIDTFKLASDQLKSRPGTLNHLFVADVPWEQRTNEPIQTESIELDEVNEGLVLVKASLSGAQEFPGDGPVQDRTIDLSKFFVTDPTKAISIRSKLSSCAGSLAFPDATFNGLFPLGISVHPDMVAEIGPHMLGLTCADKGAPLLDTDQDYVFIWDDPGYPQESKSVEIFNRGTKELRISSITLDGPNASDFAVTTGSQTGACSSLTPTLATGTSCTVALTVKRPAVNYGYLNAELKVASDDPTNPLESIQVQGYEVPPPAGAVSGRIKDASTQQGVQGYVRFFNPDGNLAREQWTDQNGAFTVNGLYSGNYKVKYTAADDFYLEQWHQGKQTQETADIVKLTPANTTLPDAALVRGAGKIQGVVKDGSNSAFLPGVMLTLYDPQTTKPLIYDFTDGSGQFHMSRIAPGRYVLKVGDTGQLRAPRWVDVTVTALSTTSLGDIALNEGGKVSGIIRDVGTQAPIRDVIARFYDSQTGAYVGGTGTDTSGYYSMNGLPTGSYKILFSGEWEGYQKLWYGNAQSMAMATVVNVTAPNSVTGIDTKLGRVADTRTTLTGQGSANQVTLTATVSSDFGIPGGTVIFKERDTVLHTAQLDASGQATVTIPLSPGTHYIYAYYDGNSSFNISSSDDVWTLVTQQMFNLSVNIAGNGSVNSSPSGIACTSASSATCSNSFPAGSVTLMQTPSAGSVFSGWSGACSGTGSCVVAMNGTKLVTATFSAQPFTVRLGMPNAPYAYVYSLGGGIGAVKADGLELRAKAQTFTEQLILNSGYAMYLKGGYTDNQFSMRDQTSFTILDGSLKIREGNLTVERFKIR